MINLKIIVKIFQCISDKCFYFSKLKPVKWILITNSAIQLRERSVRENEIKGAFSVPFGRAGMRCVCHKTACLSESVPTRNTF